MTDEDTYPYWTCSAQTIGAEDQEYKLVILRAPDSRVEWEPLAENRRLELGRLKKRVKVHASWGDASSDVRTGELPASAAERTTPPQSPTAAPSQASIAFRERRKSAPSIYPGGGAPPAHWQSFTQPAPDGGQSCTGSGAAAASSGFVNPPLELRRGSRPSSGSCAWVIRSRRLRAWTARGRHRWLRRSPTSMGERTPGHRPRPARGHSSTS